MLLRKLYAERQDLDASIRMLHRHNPSLGGPATLGTAPKKSHHKRAPRRCEAEGPCMDGSRAGGDQQEGPGGMGEEESIGEEIKSPEFLRGNA